MSDQLVPYDLPVDPEALNRALMAGDLSKLSPADRTNYYLALCRSNGLNPLTRPFITMKTQDGSVQWYPTVGCAEQLRKRDRVSMRIVGRERTDDGLYIVTALASTPDGRTEEAQGIVALSEPRTAWRKNDKGESVKTEEKSSSGEVILVRLYGKALENALMRAENKAKRRATFAICGLGLHSAEADALQEVRFDLRTGELHSPPVEEDPVPDPQPVGAEQAARNVALLFDRSDGRPDDGA